MALDMALITCLLQNETVINIANKHNKSPSQVLLAWGLQHQTSVIPRATQLSQQKVRPLHAQQLSCPVQSGT